MKILLLSLFFIILIGLFYFLKKTPKLGIIHNPLREGVDSGGDCPNPPSNGIYNYDVNKFPQCQLQCDDGFAAYYDSNDGSNVAPVCVAVPSNVDDCSGCVKLNKDGTYTSAEGSCDTLCKNNQFCSTIATKNNNGYTYKGECFDINKSPGNCVGTFKYINDSDCINGKIMIGKYVSDTGGMFGANCGSYAQKIFNDHKIFPTLIDWANSNKELIAFETCPLDCSGEWNNSAPSITECTDGYYTKPFISDPATPMNGGLSCMEIAKRNLIPINTGSTPTNIIKDADGNIIAKQSCHIDCSGTWGDFTPLSCNPPVPSGTPGSTSLLVHPDNPPNKITRLWTTETSAAFEGSKSCLEVATAAAAAPQYIGYATDISSIMINGRENIKQNIYCKIDCKGDWIPLNDECNDGKATLKWNISQNSSNGGLDCSAVAHKTQGDIYYYKSADGSSSRQMINDIKCTKNNGIFDCYTSVTCPADCSYSFTEWTDCLDGKRSQTYNIHEYAKGNGKSCSYHNGTTIWENCTMPWKTPAPKPDRYITEAPCRLDNRPMAGSDKCSEKCVPYLPPYCENINQGVDAHGNAVNGICCPFYDPTNSVNCQQCGTVKYHDASKYIDKNIIKMYQEDNNDSKLPEWKRKIANLTTNSKNVLSDILKKII